MEDNPAPRRGRPKTGQKRRVYDDLLAAAERLLVEKSQAEITQRELTASAGTTDAMLQYYFGGKDGLMIALMERAVENVFKGLCQLESEILTLPGNPTRHLIQTLHNLYYAHIAVVRMWFTAQISRDSRIKSSFVESYASKNTGQVYRILQRLIDNGVYDARANVPLAAFSLTNLIVSPILQPAMQPARGLSDETFSSPEWIDYITKMLDSQLRPLSG